MGGDFAGEVSEDFTAVLSVFKGVVVVVVVVGKGCVIFCCKAVPASSFIPALGEAFLSSVLFCALRPGVGTLGLDSVVVSADFGVAVELLASS